MIYYHKLTETEISDSKVKHSSGGFDNWGRPIKYRTAKDAGITIPYMPTDYAFYDPLDNVKLSWTAPTGQTINTYGYQYGYQWSTIYKGVPCTYTKLGYCLFCNNPTGCSTGDNPWTLAIWVCPTSIDTNYNYSVALLLGSAWTSNKLSATVGCGTESVSVWNVNSGLSGFAPITLDNWYFLGATYDGSTLTGYCNTTAVSTAYSSMQIGNSRIIIGGNDTAGGNSMRFEGYLAAPRIYNRALSKKQMLALSREFKPTA